MCLTLRKEGDRDAEAWFVREVCLLGLVKRGTVYTYLGQRGVVNGKKCSMNGQEMFSRKEKMRWKVKQNNGGVQVKRVLLLGGPRGIGAESVLGQLECLQDSHGRSDLQLHLCST